MIETAGTRARNRDRPMATVKIDSKTCPVTDISEAGVVIDEYTGDLVVKQRIYFDLIVPVGEKEQDFRVEATIVKLEKGRMVAKFLDLRKDARRAILGILAQRQGIAAPPPRAG
jgi:hypothetical protein